MRYAGDGMESAVFKANTFGVFPQNLLCWTVDFSRFFRPKPLLFYKPWPFQGNGPQPLPSGHGGSRLERMSFVRRITMGDERIIMIARLHWIYLLIGVLWLAGAVGIGLLADNLMWTYTHRDLVNVGFSLPGFPVNIRISLPFTWLFGAGGMVFFLSLLLRWLSTEIGLTSKRIVYKTGLFMVEVEEVDLEEIKAEQVHHGVFGYFLGY